MSGSLIVLAAEPFAPWEVLQAELGELSDFNNTFRLVLRLPFALGLAALVGEDRERVGKAAGLRTHMLVSLGAALLVVVPQMAGMGNVEVSRVIQGALAGIGFIGGGAILKLSQEKKVQGLTTAASLWVATGIGLAAGMGRLWSAALAAGTAYAVLAGIGWIERRFEKKAGAKGPSGPRRGRTSPSERAKRGRRLAPPSSGPVPARPQGFRTTLMHSSCLSRNVRYAAGASSSGSRCVIRKLGSISPFWMRSSSGRR